MTFKPLECGCSRRSWLGGGLAGLVAWLAPMGTWAQPVAQGMANSSRSGLPDLGDGAGLSLGDEKRLGDDILRQIYRDPSFLDDPMLADHVQAIWQPLMQSALQGGDLTPEMAERFDWTLLLANDPSINAFALPGGNMGLHLGLLAEVDSADELASVMAHELAHVCQRHIARMLERQSQQAPWLLAAMILGAVAASRSGNSGAELGQATMVGGQALAMQGQLNFSRDMEREADRMGLGIHTGAGFAPQGFVGMFSKLDHASRLNDNGAYPYLRSHPLTTERMADMSARVARLRAAAGGAGIGPYAHGLMAARAKALSDDSVDRLRGYAGYRPLPPLDSASAPARWQAHALGAFAALRLREPVPWAEHTRAMALLLPNDDATQRHWRCMALLAQPVWGDAPQVWTAWGDSPDARVTWGLQQPQRAPQLLAAQAIVARKSSPAVAIERLQAWVTQRPKDAGMWQALAGLHLLDGRPLRAARAEAEVAVAHADWQGAYDRLKGAQRLARASKDGDDFELAIIDSRTRWVHDQLRAFLDAQKRAR